MNAVLTVAVGAVLAGVFALAGVRYGARNEHAQWLRNARMEAYETLLNATLKARIHQAISQREKVPNRTLSETEVAGWLKPLQRGAIG
jgi:hypothetical protein